MDQPTIVDFSFAIQKIVMHPDMVLADIGDTYKGIPLVRDADMPMYQVKMECGNRTIVLKYARTIDTSVPGTIKIKATPSMELLDMPIVESDDMPLPFGIRFGESLL